MGPTIPHRAKKGYPPYFVPNFRLPFILRILLYTQDVKCAAEKLTICHRDGRRNSFTIHTIIIIYTCFCHFAVARFITFRPGELKKDDRTSHRHIHSSKINREAIRALTAELLSGLDLEVLLSDPKLVKF